MLPQVSQQLLADFAPLSPTFQSDIYSVVLIFAAVGGLILGAIGIWVSMRRQPPLDAELVRFSSAIDVLKKSVDELAETAKEHADHESEITGLKEKVKLLESRREEDLQAQRKYTRETTHEIFEKIDGLVETFNNNTRTMERALGGVEGGLKGLQDRVGNIEVTVRKT